VGLAIEPLEKGKSGVKKSVADPMGDVERELSVLTHDRGEPNCGLLAKWRQQVNHHDGAVKVERLPKFLTSSAGRGTE
jgi:hypothetical protein